MKRNGSIRKEKNKFQDRDKRQFTKHFAQVDIAGEPFSSGNAVIVSTKKCAYVTSIRQVAFHLINSIVVSLLSCVFLVIRRCVQRLPTRILWI